MTYLDKDNCFKSYKHFFLSIRRPALIQIYQTKSVEDYLPCRHVLLLLKHSLWVLYGLPRVSKDNILVTTSNGVGFIFLVLISDDVDVSVQTRKSTLLSLFHVLILVAIFYVTSLFGVESFSFRHTFIGVVCNIFTPMIDVLIAIVCLSLSNLIDR